MKHTPGPWWWTINVAAKHVTVFGRNSDVVMDFVRYGMQSSAPRFRADDGLMYRADELAIIEHGREHHSSWHKVLNHPDAKLIAAAPDLLEALKDARFALYGDGPGSPKIDAAIRKAEGR